MKKRAPGDVRHAAFHNKRLFLFPNDKLQKEFVANSGNFENADLVLNGLCSVCRVEMGKDVQGKPEFSVIHSGMRYLFPRRTAKSLGRAGMTNDQIPMTNF